MALMSPLYEPLQWYWTGHVFRLARMLREVGQFFRPESVPWPWNAIKNANLLVIPWVSVESQKNFPVALSGGIISAVLAFNRH
jgi:hypothetical protein